ncbi:MAG: hypothetical protein JSW56_00350 [Deltaproteobacteria bacterium]|nr:MAG: hypothetical protein JSW56_00350 [Deltaproteobacteria bacterium]
MTRLYTHDLNREVHSIAGWYRIFKEERVTLKGKEYLYLVGDGVVESSCCGAGGCRYIVVPGSVVSWKSGTQPEGILTSLVEPVTDKDIQNELREILSKEEGVSQVQFW